MIKKPTVFILGAGASMPYGYPSGEALVTQIISELSDKNQLFDLCRKLEFDELELNNFADTLRRSGDKSIDAFIERFPKYKDLGKVVITIKLIEKESEADLFPFGKYKDQEKWYGIVVNNLKSPTIETFANNVSFLTFNYDRSFDHYLFISIMNSYEEIKDPRQCAEVVKKIPLIHLHGNIGKLPWQEGDGIERPYGSNFDKLDMMKRLSHGFESRVISEARHAIRDLSNQIKIISEAELDKDAGFQDAKKLLSEANNIYFLGFGYHDDNLRRLNISGLSPTIKRNITGTTYGLGTAKKNHIKEITKGKIDLLKINNINSTIVNFLEECVDFE